MASSSSATELTPEVVAYTATNIRKLLRRLRITKLECSPLFAELSELDWLAQQGEFFRGTATPDGAEANRVAYASIRALRLAYVERALGACSALAGFRNLLTHLRNLRVDLKGPADMAWDLLFELELAARFRSERWTVGFFEPDFRLHDKSGLSLSFACKRPRSIDSLLRAVAKGAQQVTAQATPGVVAVSLDHVLKPWWECDDREDAQRTMNKALEDFVRAHQPDVNRTLAPYVLDHPAPHEGHVVDVLYSYHAGWVARPGRESCASLEWVFAAPGTFVRELVSWLPQCGRRGRKPNHM